jgi:hypothetical protein
MEELCQPDHMLGRTQWHRKLQDQTATKGMPPGAIALAATMVSPPVSQSRKFIEAHATCTYHHKDLLGARETLPWREGDPPSVQRATLPRGLGTLLPRLSRASAPGPTA